ncbi:MAG TPA: hypothetical protein PK728_08440 [Bacillota bacterium]|nr:hypothetical protein [Bacillota bacterium]
MFGLLKKERDKMLGSLDNTATDAGAYVLGILWGTVSVTGEGYWVRHRDKWYIDTVREHFGITVTGHESYSETGIQYRLKITRAADLAVVKAILETHGWTPRKAPQRVYPCGPIDHRGFVRAWVELHSSADIARTGQRRTPTPRLRIYGNRLLMEEMNCVISASADVPLRTMQKTMNETTVALLYTGSSFAAVLEWLYDKASLYNPTAREKFGEVLAKRV